MRCLPRKRKIFSTSLNLEQKNQVSRKFWFSVLLLIIENLFFNENENLKVAEIHNFVLSRNRRNCTIVAFCVSCQFRNPFIYSTKLVSTIFAVSVAHVLFLKSPYYTKEKCNLNGVSVHLFFVYREKSNLYIAGEFYLLCMGVL